MKKYIFLLLLLLIFPLIGKAETEVIGAGSEGSTWTDRGDISAADFAGGDLTIDNAWHDLDLSSIVPAGATRVLLRLYVDPGTALYRVVAFRKNGNTNTANNSGLILEADTISLTQYQVVCDSNRVIEYLVNDTLTTINITVVGWY